jgi:hypothetical protein
MMLVWPRVTSSVTSCRNFIPRSSEADRASRCNLGANVPQAWAAGSVFMLTQALLGFMPDAPRKKLYVDPSLPTWLPDLTVRDLRIGKHKLDIRFWREGEKTEFEVLKGNPQLVERCDIASKAAELRTDLTEPSQSPAERSKRENRARNVERVRPRTLS